MQKDSNYYRNLLDKWLQSTCSPHETSELLNYLQTDPSSRDLLQTLREEFPFEPGLNSQIPDEVSDRVRGALLAKIENAPVIPIKRSNIGKRWMHVAAAVLVLVGLSIAGFYLFRHPTEKAAIVNAELPTVIQHDIPAGSFRAILTLADGTRIELDDHAKGPLEMQGPSTVINNEGQLVYESTEKEPGEPQFNTLSSARGQSYSLVLADGSRLWLNAASSVKFPVAFTGNERKVEITGEVYFEVAKDAKKPFRVKTRSTEIEVLGTRFDINAYDDEATVNTTLVEGAVKVSSAKGQVQLAPGQQSRVATDGQSRVFNDINLDEVIAWKNGYFHFDNADLRSILRQFSRWYDIEVVYEGNVKNRKFLAIVSRSSSLANVLKMLNANNIQFSIEGKKLVVQSN